MISLFRTAWVKIIMITDLLVDWVSDLCVYVQLLVVYRLRCMDHMCTHVVTSVHAWHYCMCFLVGYRLPCGRKLLISWTILIYSSFCLAAMSTLTGYLDSRQAQSHLSQQQGSGDDDAGKKKKTVKRRKVNHACLYCRRSHMTCDEGRPCQRW
jgi:hypothetical protein